MIERNIFLENDKKPDLTDYMKFNSSERGNLGNEIPVLVYRLLEYSIREEIINQYGKEKQVEIFRNAGRRAGIYFAQNLLDLTLPFHEFIAQLQARIEEMKIGVLRVENIEKETGKIILTISEDADCSGLPLLGETVCNFDEGFISGILSTYSGKNYQSVEVDCWATGDRVCRFCAEASDK
ncbi:MAG: 4-vinyl reductase [Lachnospiraceae bacterium]|nr:4-vinyl reductase [Lachnospiraceae bacterium]